MAICFFDLFINYSIRLGYGVILPEMIQDLGLSRTAGGTIFNAFFFSYIALTPITGYLTDRLGARRVITICGLILGLGVLLMGTINTLAMACLFFAIAGLGSTGMWTPVITLVQRWFAPHRRGLALGIISSGPGFGFATMGAAFPWIVNNYNWRYAWYFLGVGALTMVLFNGLLLRSDPQDSGYIPWGEKPEDSLSSERHTTSHKRSGSLSSVLKDRRFWLIGLSYLSINYSLYGITTFLMDYARDQIGLPLEKASLLATVHGLSQVAGVLTILPLSDYLGRKRTIIISSAFITACLTGILFTGESWKALFILVGILACFFGATYPMYGACAGDYFPRDMIGTVVGAWTPLYGLGAILAHWVSGMLRDATGIYDHAFMINAVMAGISILLICAVKKSE